MLSSGDLEEEEADEEEEEECWSSTAFDAELEVTTRRRYDMEVVHQIVFEFCVVVAALSGFGLIVGWLIRRLGEWRLVGTSRRR